MVPKIYRAKYQREQSCPERQRQSQRARAPWRLAVFPSALSNQPTHVKKPREVRIKHLRVLEGTILWAHTEPEIVPVPINQSKKPHNSRALDGVLRKAWPQ